MALPKVDTNSLLNGALGGAAANAGARYLGPDIGPAVGTAAVGVFRKDPWLMHMSGYQLGARFAAAVPGIGGAAPEGGFL